MSDAPERIWIQSNHIPDSVALDKWDEEPDADEAHLFTGYLRADHVDALVAAADALADWVEGIIEDGCPLCGGDCSSSNPPPTYCPQKDAMRDLAAYNEAKKGGA
jgi:hypothetical protein